MSLEPKVINVARVQLRDQYDNALSVDEMTKSIIIVDYPHHERHEGSNFDAQLSTNDLDSNPLRVNFKVPSSSINKVPHLFIIASVSGQAILELREAYTGGGTGGSDLIPNNSNRNSLKESSLISTHGTPTPGIITQGATAATGGTLLIPGENLGVGINKQAATSRSEGEWILKTDTLYQISLTSSVNLIIATLIVDWYEHSLS